MTTLHEPPTPLNDVIGLTQTDAHVAPIAPAAPVVAPAPSEATPRHHHEFAAACRAFFAARHEPKRAKRISYPTLRPEFIEDAAMAREMLRL